MSQLTHHLRTPEGAADYLAELQNGLDPPYRTLIQRVLTHPDFARWPSSLRRHHAFPGGLLLHTAQVVSLLRATLYMLPGAQMDLATVAAVWHDFGKLWDYRPDPNPYSSTWIATTHDHAIRHVARSYAEFLAYQREAQLLGAGEEEFVGHLILSHHGRKEWGSPIEYQNAEAWALHSADLLSSHYLGDRPCDPIHTTRTENAATRP